MLSSGLTTPPCESEQPIRPVVGRVNSSSTSMTCHETSELAKTPNPIAIADRNSPDTPNTSTKPFLHRDSFRLDNCLLQAPYEYVSSLPSKGVRSQVIDALNIWFRAPTSSVEMIKEVVHTLQSASLMLDDFQDSSPLRRGKPSTHTIFGSAQTVNSAGYHIIAALSKIKILHRPEAVTIALDELQALYGVQSFDLYWTSNMLCPSILENIAMIDDKTRGLFRLLIRLLQTSATSDNITDIFPLGHLLGRYS